MMGSLPSLVLVYLHKKRTQGPPERSNVRTARTQDYMYNYFFRLLSRPIDGRCIVAKSAYRGLRFETMPNLAREIGPSKREFEHDSFFCFLSNARKSGSSRAQIRAKEAQC